MYSTKNSYKVLVTDTLYSTKDRECKYVRRDDVSLKPNCSILIN